MKSPREYARELIERLPDDVSIEAIIEELAFVASVLRGLEDARAGRVYTTEEVRARLNKKLEARQLPKLREPVKVDE
jgi:predicted transcriptional regulator